jgi:hypothetical protein
MVVGRMKRPRALIMVRFRTRFVEDTQCEFNSHFWWTK